MIALHQVTRQFAGKRDVIALDAVSLAIPRGEMVSIIGPSGSGKSTLLNLVGGLDRPTSGQVTVDGEPLADLSDDGLTKVRRDKIGFIFQFFNLLADALVRRKRRPPAAPARLAAQESRRARARAAEPRPARSPPAAPARRALRRRTPARRDRPRARRSTRPSCSPMNRPATSTRAPAKKSSR